MARNTCTKPRQSLPRLRRRVPPLKREEVHMLGGMNGSASNAESRFAICKCPRTPSPKEKDACCIMHRGGQYMRMSQSTASAYGIALTAALTRLPSPQRDESYFFHIHKQNPVFQFVAQIAKTHTCRKQAFPLHAFWLVRCWSQVVSMAVNTIYALSTEVFFHADFHILTFLWLTFILLDITLSSWVQPTTSGQPVRIPDGPRWKATAAAPGAPTNRLFDCLYL